MIDLDIIGLCKQYRLGHGWVQAISNLDLNVADGSFIVVVGKSGCGKTTLLRLICGLEEADQGRICIRDCTDRNRHRRVSIVFQEPRLMPWLTVRQNMAFGLRKVHNRQKADHTVNHFLDMLGLKAFQNAYPHQISGGMAQRTALGRTLCFDPEIILMDEPFGALDAFTRRKLQQELVDIFLAHKKTIIFVTHDVDEAVLLGQRIVVMENGSKVCDFNNDLSFPRDPLAPPFLRIREKIIRTILD